MNHSSLFLRNAERDERKNGRRKKMDEGMTKLDSLIQSPVFFFFFKEHYNRPEIASNRAYKFHLENIPSNRDDTRR